MGSFSTLRKMTESGDKGSFTFLKTILSKVRSFFAEPSQTRQDHEVFKGRRSTHHRRSRRQSTFQNTERRSTIQPMIGARRGSEMSLDADTARKSQSTPSGRWSRRGSRRQSIVESIDNEIRARQTLIEQKSNSLLDFIKEEDELAEIEAENEKNEIQNT